MRRAATSAPAPSRPSSPAASTVHVVTPAFAAYEDIDLIHRVPLYQRVLSAGRGSSRRRRSRPRGRRGHRPQRLFGRDASHRAGRPARRLAGQRRSMACARRSRPPASSCIWRAIAYRRAPPISRLRKGRWRRGGVSMAAPKPEIITSLANESIKLARSMSDKKVAARDGPFSRRGARHAGARAGGRLQSAQPLSSIARRGRPWATPCRPGSKARNPASRMSPSRDGQALRHEQSAAGRRAVEAAARAAPAHAGLSDPTPGSCWKTSAIPAISAPSSAPRMRRVPRASSSWATARTRFRRKPFAPRPARSSLCRS